MRAFVASMILVALLAGCASEATVSDAPPSIDPAFGDVCVRMSIAEASEASERAITTATPLVDAPGCAYESADGATFIGVEIVDEAYWEEFKASDHLLAAVGDEAMWDADLTLLILVVRDGSDYFSVVVRQPPGSPVPALQVATRAAAFVIAPPP